MLRADGGCAAHTSRKLSLVVNCKLLLKILKRKQFELSLLYKWRLAVVPLPCCSAPVGRVEVQPFKKAKKVKIEALLVKMQQEKADNLQHALRRARAAADE